MRIDGGEPEKILELPYSVSTPQWMPDGQRVEINGVKPAQLTIGASQNERSPWREGSHRQGSTTVPGPGGGAGETVCH
jgi:hypothetical protein